jgi:hypothetical protein
MRKPGHSILAKRVPVGLKIVSKERDQEARRLNQLLEANAAFSFIRLGDCEFELLEGDNDLQRDYARSVSGTQTRWTTGLDWRHREALLDAIRSADFVDFLDLNWPEDFEPLQRYRSMARDTCSSYQASYILGTWVEKHFKEYCKNRRILFCGAEAPILENLCRDPEYLEAAKEFFEPNEQCFFLRPREDGRNLPANLYGIKEDIIAEVKKHSIQTVFLSLGAGAKILCVELSKQLGIHAIDFGAMMRSLSYSGSDGNCSGRSPHTLFLFRVPFLNYMASLYNSFPQMKPEVILAKAHAQLLLEIQKKEVAWSCDALNLDFNVHNIERFKFGYSHYKHRYKSLFKLSAATRRERIDFLHFCGKHRLTLEGRIFHSYFNLKSTITTWLRKL